MCFNFTRRAQNSEAHFLIVKKGFQVFKFSCEFVYQFIKILPKVRLISVPSFLELECLNFNGCAGDVRAGINVKEITKRSEINLSKNNYYR